MSLTNKIEKTDLARDALYEKVNTIAEELDDKKQDNLVSGTNIKTINGESIVGSGDLEIKSGGGSGRNVGDIFYTTRTDTELNGAVECNGGTYNIRDFEGNQSIGKLLNAGSLPYVSLSEYENLIIENGSCRAFGWDGGTSFRVPTIPALLLAKEQSAVVGNGMTLGLTDGTNNFGLRQTSSYFRGAKNMYGVNVGDTSSATGLSSDGTSYGVTTDPTKSGIVANLDVIEYRAMVQLANEATDEAVITATSALQQISEIVPTITYWE